VTATLTLNEAWAIAETVSESEADPISRDAKAQSKYKGKP